MTKDGTMQFYRRDIGASVAMRIVHLVLQPLVVIVGEDGPIRAMFVATSYLFIQQCNDYRIERVWV